MAVIKLRKVSLPDGGKAELTVRNRHGEPVPISIRSLSPGNEKMLLWALGYIKSHYNPEKFDVPVETILRVASAVGFLQTDSPDIYAYGGRQNDDPKGGLVVIFNRNHLKPANAAGKRELVVSVLHELIHLLEGDKPNDKSAATEYEARLDIQCYIAMGFDVPVDHWGWARLGIDARKELEEQKSK